MEIQERFDAFLKKTKHHIVGETKSIDELEGLYHYTSSAVLKNILLNESVWITKSDFMNDEEEIKYAVDFVEEVVERHGRLDSRIKNYMLEELEERKKDYLFGNIHIMSFSKDGDSLALWTTYGKEDGYNIKFSREFFYDMFNSCCNFVKEREDVCSYDFEIKVNKVIYDKKVQEEIINEILDEIDYLDRNYMDERRKAGYIDILIGYIMDYVTFFKHPAYESEGEYRIVLIFENEDYKYTLLKHRIFKGAFIPYIEIRIDVSYIKEIKIGPRNSFNLTMNGLKSLISTYPNINARIKKSEIPLRF